MTTTPGEALDLIISLHITADDLDPGTLEPWGACLLGGIEIRPGVLAASSPSGQLELAAPFGAGRPDGWVIYRPHDCSAAILDRLPGT